jgi:hypothetical protein
MQLFAYVIRYLRIGDKSRRPPFKLTRLQQDQYHRVVAAADAVLQRIEDGSEEAGPGLEQLHKSLDRAVVDLYIAILDHYTKEMEYTSVLVSFLMVLSVCEDGGWEGYGIFTPKLSAIMANSRLMILQSAIDTREQAIEELVRRGTRRLDAEDQSPGLFKLVEEMVKRFIVDSIGGYKTTPTQFIVRLRNYSRSEAAREGIAGSISWDGEDCIYKGVRVGTAGLQAMLMNTIRQAEIVLLRDLLLYKGSLVLSCNFVIT